MAPFFTYSFRPTTFLGTVALAIYVMALSPVYAKPSKKPTQAPSINEEVLIAEDEAESLSYAENESLPQKLKESENSEEKKEFISKD